MLFQMRACNDGKLIIGVLKTESKMPLFDFASQSKKKAISIPRALSFLSVGMMINLLKTSISPKKIENLLTTKIIFRKITSKNCVDLVMNLALVEF